MEMKATEFDQVIEEIVTSTLRVTTLFRPEEGTWKVVHRHADPVNAPRLREALTQQ